MSTNVPLPALIVKPVAVSAGPSISPALASSSAWVMVRAPLSSAMAVKVTGVVVGASLTGLTVILALADVLENAVLPPASTD